MVDSGGMRLGFWGFVLLVTRSRGDLVFRAGYLDVFDYASDAESRAEE